MSNDYYLICGTGEFASAIAISLFRASLPVILLPHPEETWLRFNLCLGEALSTGTKSIEGVTASAISPELLAEFNHSDPQQNIKAAADFLLRDRKLPVITEMSFPEILKLFKPKIVVDTLGENYFPVSDAEAFTIGLQPPLKNNRNLDVIINCRLNYHLGSIHLPDHDIQPEPAFDHHFFKNPFESCQSPIEGLWVALKKIGDPVAYNEPLGKVNEIEIRCPYSGQVWGIVHSGKLIGRKQAVGLIYQGPPTQDYRYFSFLHRTVAGSVLEAVLRFRE